MVTKRKLIQRLRTFGQEIASIMMCWVDKHVITPADWPSFRFEFGCWIDGWLGELFGFFYNGSDEEIEAVLNGEIPRRYMSWRQREAGRAAALSGHLFEEVICVHCETEPLLIEDETNLCAHCRALHPEMLLEYSVSSASSV
jgi:hypothetical protein